MPRLAMLVASVLMAFPVVGVASTRYDPRLRFQTISTARFDIHYHQGGEAEARRLAEIAETVAASLDATLGPPSGRVQVILVDQSDLSNGWATPLPFNTIEITAAAPGGDSLLGNTRDWLRLVFTHEYTHVVHLSRGRGWIGGLRRIVGRMPLLYPNLYLPSWQIEGIATYEEGGSTRDGRVRDGRFRTILDVANASSRFEPLDRASGGLVDWPSGHTPYLYGSYFHDYLAAKYGADSLTRLTDATAGAVPYFGARSFRKVFGKPLGQLWQDFELASRRDVPDFAAAIVRLTHHGFNVTGPRFGGDGRIYYSVANPHGFPSLLSIDARGRTPRIVTRRYLGDRIAVAGSRLIFDEIEVVHDVGLQSDLYAVDREGGRKIRLTREMRAADPDVSPDGTTIVCTIQRIDRRELATIRLTADGASDPVTLVSEPGVNFKSPRWSPDGRTIAVERGADEIVLIDPVTTRVRGVIASSPASRSVSPEWLADGRLIFASDREGGGFRLYRTDPSTFETSRLEGTGPDARSPAVSTDGRSLVFVGYTAAGYDLFLLPLESARWSAANREVLRPDPPTARSPISTPASAQARAYSPWRTIAPRFWTPTIETDADEFVIGAATASNDALGRHAYAVQAGWTTSRGRPDWSAVYVYDRWWPTFFADDTDPWRGRELRTREINAGLLLPFRRIRWTQTLLGAVHAAIDQLNCASCEPQEIARTALRGGWRVDAARAFGYSISLEEGWSTSATTELTRRAFGADGNGGAATVDVRAYVPLAPRHAVAAARFAAATTWGDRSVRRVFSASGSGPQPGGLFFGSDAIGLLRGVADDEIAGRHAIVANVDYRFPLWRLDRGSGTLPIFARVLHGSVFIDAGHAWDTGFRRSDVHTTIGAELSMDAVIGYSLPMTLTTGAAWISSERGFAAFGRIGRAF
jgi:hypothetical protein